MVVATGKARPAAIRAASTQGLDGIIVGKNTPGVFLQGLEVYGRGGELVYEAKMPEDVTRDAFMMMKDVVHRDLALTAFCGDTCARRSKRVHSWTRYTKRFTNLRATCTNPWTPYYLRAPFVNFY